MGAEVLPVDTAGETEAAAPGAVAEFTQQRSAADLGRSFGARDCLAGIRLAGLGRRVLLGVAPLRTDQQGAIGGLDVDGIFVNSGEFKNHFVGVVSFMHLCGGYPLGVVQLLFEPLEQVKGRGGAKGQHGGLGVG